MRGGEGGGRKKRILCKVFLSRELAQIFQCILDICDGKGEKREKPILLLVRGPTATEAMHALPGSPEATSRNFSNFFFPVLFLFPIQKSINQINQNPCHKERGSSPFFRAFLPQVLQTGELIKKNEKKDNVCRYFEMDPVTFI